MIGEVLGNRYEILEKIGEGGMAVVYKARCNKLNRYVAVKILKNEFADNEEIVSKFKREATAIATLSDNNIVNILDVGTQDSLNYIVMEYVNGKTLKEVIKQFGKLNYETAVSIGIQIAKALECAHKNNIIHRDVKPQNILVTETGVIKVTDFGIAKSSTSATLTNTTTIMGSAHYFSPEQAKGSMVDARTDLYSLGVVLYEMVTGKLPFEADSPVTIALKHIQEEVIAPKELNPKVPESLSKLIVKAMEKDPNKRYQSAREMISDLQKIKEDPNAIINNIEEDKQNEHTIVMAPIKENTTTPSVNKKLEDDYYEEDEIDDDDYYEEDDDYEEDKPKKKKNNKKLITGIVIAALALLGLGVGAFFIFGGSNNGKDVEVPDLKGMTVEEARKALSDIGLVYEEGDVEESDEKEGIVLKFYPEKGSKLAQGGRVRVVVSVAKNKLKMINFVDEPLDTLNSFIAKHGLKEPLVNEEFSDNIKAGNIISTNPEAYSEIDPKMQIKVVVSKGPKIKKNTVPNVNGYNLNDAQNAMESKGFKITPTYKDVTDRAQDGLVIYQSIAAGTEAAEGTEIRLTIGKYKEEEPTMYIDKIINKAMTGAEAKVALENAGFKVNVTGDLNDKVSSWNPNEVKKGATINIATRKADQPAPPAAEETKKDEAVDATK